MPRQKQQAPSRGGAYARSAASRARAASAAAREADGDDVAAAAGADEARPARRRRVAADAQVALQSRLAALPGARRVGALPLTWHGAPATPATVSALQLRGADDDSDSDAQDTAPSTANAPANAAAGASGADAGRTPFVALACGGGAGDAPLMRGAVGAPRSVAEAVATLVASGVAAAALSPDGALLRIALLPCAFADAPATPTEGGASGIHAALRAALPFLLAGGAPARSCFDPAALFALLRREGGPALAPRLRGLRPKLRPYQARAAAWLVARETGAAAAQWAPGATHPLWQRVASPPDADDDAARIETTPHGAPVPPECSSSTAFFFCAATGRLALAPFPPPALPRGGILADEMGLGKTVELLALVCANRFTPDDGDDDVADAAAPDAAESGADGDGPPWRGERVACACGEDADDFEGTWVQCGACLAWSHAPCVDYRPPRRKRARNADDDEAEADPAVDFECGRCRAWRAATPLRSRCGATLVVCPAPLVEQWRRELLRHISSGDDDDDGMPALRVRVYSGQSQAAGGPGGHGASVVTAAELGSYDVVITSYDVLRAELHRGSDDAAASASAQFGRASRRGGEGSKRYSIVPTPLTRLTWWRLVCDEAQAVESSAAAATAMARRLRAAHRWCVTGTPVCRGGADDVHGLLTFLEAPPLADVALWRAAVGRRVASGDGAGAASALAACISPLFWRTSRAEAGANGELQLPPQGSLLTWLALSPLERHWYAAQHSRCAADAARALRGGGSDAAARDAPLPHQQLQAVLRGPLLRLRQACDHPQVGAGGITGGAGGGVLTMSEIHARLEEKARNEAEEAQRALAMGLNALAGLALIRSDAHAAAHLYRTVLALEDRPADAAGPDAAAQNPPGDGLRLDALQRLHALRNLHAALAATSAAAGSNAAAASRIAEERLALARDADVIAEAYLAPHVARAAAAARDLARASRAADPSALPTGADGWWLAALGRAARASDGGSALAQRLRDAVQERWQDAAVPFTSCAGAQAALTASLRDIGAARRELLATAAALDRATSAASPADVWAAGHCGACRGGAGVASVRCRHCVAAEGPVAAAENALFGRQIKASMPGRHVEEADVGAGRSAPSSAETCLRALAGWVTRSDGCADLADAARAHLEQLEGMRREFAKASAAMLAQRTALAARDELDMAATRLRLRTEAEASGIGRDPVPVHLRMSVLHPHEAVAAEAAAREARGGHEAALAAARAQLRWLRSLKHRDAAADAADAEGAAGTADDVCPVCHDALRAGHTSVLPCGHALCVRCTLYMAGRARGAAATAAAAAVPPARAAAAPPPPPVRLSCPKCRRAAPSDQIFTVAAASDQAAPSADAAADVAAPASGVLSVAGTCPGRDAGDPASAAARAFAEAVAAEEGRVRVQGAWGTKLDAVVRRILFLCQREPGCKVR